MVKVSVKIDRMGCLMADSESAELFLQFGSDIEHFIEYLSFINGNREDLDAGWPVEAVIDDWTWRQFTCAQ